MWTFKAIRLRRFLPPQVVDLINRRKGTEKQLESHRREITALFCDLRGFTGFTESADAEEIRKLKPYRTGSMLPPGLRVTSLSRGNLVACGSKADVGRIYQRASLRNGAAADVSGRVAASVIAPASSFATHA